MELMQREFKLVKFNLDIKHRFETLFKKSIALNEKAGMGRNTYIARAPQKY